MTDEIVCECGHAMVAAHALRVDPGCWSCDANGAPCIGWRPGKVEDGTWRPLKPEETFDLTKFFGGRGPE